MRELTHFQEELIDVLAAAIVMVLKSAQTTLPVDVDEVRATLQDNAREYALRRAQTNAHQA